MFVMALGKQYRILLKGEAGVWAISYDEPDEPIFLSAESLDRYKRIQPPEDVLLAEEAQRNGQLTRAQWVRFRLVQPFLQDEVFIYDRGKRQAKAKEVAEANNTTVRRIKRLLYKFWATGQLTAKKTKSTSKVNPDENNFSWAIRTKYFSASKMSLRDAYDSMLLARYMTPDGKLSEQIPTFWSFRKFYYDHGFHRRAQRDIARDGLSHYQRDKRLLYGSAMG